MKFGSIKGLILRAGRGASFNFNREVLQIHFVSVFFPIKGVDVKNAIEDFTRLSDLVMFFLNVEIQVEDFADEFPSHQVIGRHLPRYMCPHSSLWPFIQQVEQLS